MTSDTSLSVSLAITAQRVGSPVNSYYTKATKANPLLTDGEDWPSISHTPSPPTTLTTVCDERNDDGKYGSILVATIPHISPNVNTLFTVLCGGIRVTENNSLKLTDKLVLVTLELLIPDQEEQLIKRIHIANVSGVSPRTVGHPPAGYGRIAQGRRFS